MSQIIVLNSEIHRQQGWQPVADFRFAAGNQFVPVNITELPLLLPVYPLAFLKYAAEETPRLVALTGLESGRNLYVTPDGRWTAPYIPRGLTLYPFLMQVGNAEARQFTLAFNAQSGLLRETPDTAKGEIRFFDDEGKASATVQQIIKGLQAELNGQQLTRRAVAALEKLDLLERWPGINGQDEADVRGLYRISEPKLNALDGAALKALQEANALPLAYGQLLSLARIEVLQRLAAFYARQQQSATPAAVDPGIVGKLFGGQELGSETIKFA